MNPISRLEALVGALARMNNYFDPQSDAYRLRNPIMLRAFSPKHEKSESGYRVFNSLSSGWDNAIIDVTIKCSGNSHSRLKPDDTLLNLVLCYGYPKTAVSYVKKFLRKALNDDSIRESQQLSWFLEDKIQKESKDVHLPNSESTES